MEFITKLIETENSVKLKGFQNPFMSYEESGFRSLKRIKISDDVSLSIQASYGHYCNPRQTLPLEDYTTMEIAFFKDNEFVSVDQVTDNKELINAFEECYEGTVYGYVPVELLERLYQELTA